MTSGGGGRGKRGGVIIRRGRERGGRGVGFVFRMNSISGLDCIAFLADSANGRNARTGFLVRLEVAGRSR